LGCEISKEFLDELIEDGRIEVSSNPTSNSYLTGNRSLSKIEPQQEVRLADGSLTTFEAIDQKRSVYCPFHHDQNPSAFVGHGRDGSYLSCSACHKTWLSSAATPSEHNFKDFDDFINNIKVNGLRKAPEDLVGLEKFMEQNDLLPQNISIQKERYFKGPKFKLDVLPRGVTFIKSPKGSGKTTFLSGLLKEASSDLAPDDDMEFNEIKTSSGPAPSGEKVLLIGHRQALIGELCERLGLNCYLDFKEKMGSRALEERKKRFGVCLDSLRRVDGIRYDLIVIDEVEQVLSHFFSTTIGAARFRIFEAFFRLIRSAKHVIVLDADLGWVSFNTMRTIKSLRLDEADNPTIKDTDWPVSILLNERNDTKRKLHMYNSREHLISKLRTEILAGKRVFVTSNSKKKIDALSKAVEELAKQANTTFPHVSITSTNSKTDDIQEFIRNIKTKILDYSVILSSPSLGTGVDITFPSDKQEIDCVFGLFEPRITNHFEIDQQLARVRNPGEVHVWISPQYFNFETEFDVVVDELLHGDLAAGIRYGFIWQDRQTIADKDPFLTMAAHTAVKNRASMNNLKANFINHKIDQGWDVEIVDKDDSLAAEGKELFRKGRAKSKEEEVGHIMAASVLNRIEFEKLKRHMNYENSPITTAERYNLKRTSLELFYRSEATEEIIDIDESGQFRSKIILFEALQKAARGGHNFKMTLPTTKDVKIQKTHVELVPNIDVGAALLFSILSSTQIFQNGKFPHDIEYTEADLKDFADISVKFKRFVEGQFDQATRRDVKTKPIQHLGQLLKLVGLHQKAGRSSKVGIKKIRHYSVVTKGIQMMEEIVTRRSVDLPWQYLDARQGFKYTDDETDWLIRYA
jgi:hypothetical protein